MEVLLRNYRASLGVFVFGLVVSGLAGFPLQWELQVVGAWLEIESPDAALARTVASLIRGLTARSPFFGTPWLTLGHLAFAAVLMRALLRPLRAGWALRSGVIYCAGVALLALVAGKIGAIPIHWRWVDCSLGAFGAIPLIYCLRLTRRMREMASSAPPPVRVASGSS